MKILVTGFNALSIGTARSPLNIATSARVLPEVLKELGHEVIQKAIIPGEDVSSYDKVFVFVFGLIVYQQDIGTELPIQLLKDPMLLSL
jgi:hypothetical protein